MESEFLKEPWMFPRARTNSSTKEEATAAFSAWEEDFQDLSSWCMDTFKVQCDFHIGEIDYIEDSTTFKLSGTKYEDKGISTVEEEGISKDLKSATDDEKLNLQMNTVKTSKESSDNRHLLLSPSEKINDYGLGHSNDDNNATGSWIMSPGSVASTSTASSKQHKIDVDAFLQSEHRAGGDLTSPTSPFDTIVNQRETWDELRTIETTGSNTFDLLSYLCDDEMRSLEGNVSADASTMLKLRSHATMVLPPLVSLTTTKVKTEEESNESTPLTLRRMATRATSTVTSSSSVEAPSRRSERTRTTSTRASSSKERETIVRIKTRDKNGRKRYYEESDSDDDDDDDDDNVALSQYRECREKNNEASRRSRMNKKVKESEMTIRAIELERDNKILKMKVEELEKLVTSMRNALLRSALKGVF